MSRRTSDHRFREHWPFVAILVAYLALGLAYNTTVPAFETPDEPGHLSYVRYLVAHRRFPVQQPDPELSPALEAHQPPLYYVLSAALTAWIDQAVSMAGRSGRVRLFIIWNIDFVNYGEDPMAGFAIIRPGGGCPACDALSQ